MPKSDSDKNGWVVNPKAKGRDAQGAVACCDCLEHSYFGPESKTKTLVCGHNPDLAVFRQ